MLLPFANFIEKLAIKYIPECKKKSDKTVFLDERLLLNPTLAITEAFKKTLSMADIVEFNFTYATKMLKSFHKKKAEQIIENEIQIDMYEDKIGSFLIKLSSMELGYEDSEKISQMLLTIGDFERIGDHAANILKISETLAEREQKLSTEAVAELKIIVHAVSEIYINALSAYKNNDLILAQKVEPLDAVIKKCVRRAKNNHIQRLKEGKCTIEIGFLFSDLLNNLRRVAAHAGNIAMSVIQLYDRRFDKHSYNNRNKEDDIEFNMQYQNYKSKYSVKNKNSNS
jgi:phosphate:Na+ symporter